MAIHLPQSHGPARSRRAFTIIEAAVALTITVTAGGALLLGMASSMDATNDMRDRAIAVGMAQELMDEILSKRYNGTLSGEGPRQATLGPAASEKSGNSRMLFDDIDDYNGYAVQPPKDCYGITLGTDNGQGSTRNSGFQTPSTYLNRWRQEVSVYYVNATNFAQKLTSGQSDYRAIEVSIKYVDPVRGTLELAKLRRVVANVPIP